ncbi:uncharacterized protein PHALS_04166 [Plasmopara halstedii]|uniref:Uncharacterized protein n=1 Tax=Plasmopara halstedii TaxID=4781 RepID=A0A0N7L3V3_PLAHL|nr:uncharacterized protein PHALS_04166 [Plasmopara halstedii]CEG36915.1 hypothetical protein PHALS_04166 [Plasmopara halstedii]|eukprot:XP_024573284.1 hypothetical protein PHALS_04166 [Plasmopara halstedii]
MPSSEDSNTPRSNTWTLDEFGDLVSAWELATSRPRDPSAPTLHDAVFKHFVVLRGGSTRRNKAALTSKRSALKFSYLYIRDFDSEQKGKNLVPFFELSSSQRYEVMSSWKKVNSSLVEITPLMYQGLMRIVSKGGEDDPVVPIRKRQKELQEATNTMRSESRPTRASLASNDSPLKSISSKKKTQTAAVRASSNPWSSEEMLQLMEAWTLAAKTVCETTSNDPMSIVHEIYRQFERLQGGSTTRNLSGLATRRRVLKQSYTRIAAFDKIQKMNGDLPFTDLPVATRLSVLRSWKNVNLLDLSADLYARLHSVIALDTQAVALEDLRRTKGSTTKPIPLVPGRKGGRPPKKIKAQSSGPTNEEDHVPSSQTSISVTDGEEEKALPKVTNVSDSDAKTETIAPESVIPTNETHVVSTMDQSESENHDTISSATKSPSVEDVDKKVQETTRSSAEYEQNTLENVEIDSVQDSSADKTLSCADDTSIETHEMDPKSPLLSVSQNQDDKSVENNEVESNTNAVENQSVDESARDSVVPKTDEVDESDAPTRKGPGRWGKRKRKMQMDAPNGLLWEIEELALLIKAWEKAATLVCNSDPSERLSLNREMYREFVEMQGGYSVRNDTALAARRSSLKSSHAHIFSFNEAQKAKNEPTYHNLPQDTRMSLLRSWKNRNSVDLTQEMYDTLGRIIAMDDKLAEIRHLRPPVSPKVKSSTSTLDSSIDLKAMKPPKWSTEESSDLIKACADVLNVSSDRELSHSEREGLIYDAFLARRQSAGDTDTLIRRDLRSMAQQWRCILASYSYIKACNDDRSEPNSPSWFDMTSSQKRAYQQCTNIPVKFVDLDANMFDLVTKTSFVGVSSPLLTPSLPSPIAENATDGIALRPRSARKKSDVFWSSDSESSVIEEVGGENRNDRISSGKKGNIWPQEEIWSLIQAWEEAAETTKGTRLTSALNETYALFTKRQAPFHRTRTLISVKNRMIALNSSFLGISSYIAERGESSAWFNLSTEERINEIRSWGNKTIIDLNEEMYNSLARILDRKRSEKMESGKRKQGRVKEVETKSSGSKHEKYAAANWSKDELLMLSEACGELLEGRRSRRYVFEEEKDRFFRRYEELGGTNSLAAAVGLARYVLDSYEFIYFYNQRAIDTGCLTWFELDLEDRDAITLTMSKSYRSFNGLTTVDEEIYDVLDKLDAELRFKLGEEKKKTYKPPTDATSSRYVNIESVIEHCEYKKRVETRKKVGKIPEPIDDESEEEDNESSSMELSMNDESTDSDSSTADHFNSRAASTAIGDGPSTRRNSVRRESETFEDSTLLPRKRSRTSSYVDLSSTLSITEIIHKQSQKLEDAVKQFRKDSSIARNEHHAFLLQKIQETFPIDRGHGSFLERVAERQSQSLGELFQRLQRQRDMEKAKDEELMRQLFERTERT